MQSAEEVIKSLGLEPLPVEGGFFKETYRSKTLAKAVMPHCAGTCIYYLMRGKGISAWHKVAADEIWLYHAGSAARQMLLFPDGSWTERLIGSNFANGEKPQSLIPAGTWQAASLLDRSAESWGLFGAVVVPGFEYEDFQEGCASTLSAAYPSALEKMREFGLR